MITAASWGNVPIITGEEDGGVARFVFQRATGYEPDSATLTFTESQFVRFATRLLPKRFEPGNTKTADAIIDDMAALIPRDLPAPRSELPYVADLWMAFQLEGESKPRKFPARNMYLAEIAFLGDAVKLSDGTKGERVVIVGLVDIRRWWDQYGEITQNFNVKLADGKLDVSTRVPSSSDAKPEPWPLKEQFQLLLNSLPGGHIQNGVPSRFPGATNAIVDFPDLTDISKDRSLLMWAASPKAALKSLTEDFDWVFNLNLDGSCSYYAKGDGTVGERVDGKGGNNNVSEATWNGFVAQDSRGLRVVADRPTELVYIGGHTVWSVAIDYCIPVLYREQFDPVTKTTKIQVIDATRKTLTALARGRDPFAPDTPISGELPGQAFDPRLFFKIPFNKDLWRTKIAGAEMAVRRGEQLNNNMLDAPARAKVEQELARNPDFQEFERNAEALINSQLFLAYRIPDRYRRLLPLLDRAERFAVDPKNGTPGERKPIIVEAFTFSPFQHAFTDEDLDVPDKRTLLMREVDIIQKEIRRLAAIKNRIALAKNDSIKRFVQRIVASDLLRPFNTPNKIPFTTIKKVVIRKDRPTPIPIEPLSLRDTGLTPEIILGIKDIGNLIPSINQSLRDSVNQFLALKLTSEEAFQAAIDAELQRLRKLLFKTLDKLFPARALLGEIRKLHKQRIRFQRKEKRENPLINARLSRRLLELKILRSRPQIPREEAKPNIVKLHVNRGRRPVEFRIVSAKEGVFEIVGALPGWLADPMVSNPAETEFFPMPVRITFGTRNPDPFEPSRKFSGPLATPRGENEWLTIFKAQFVQSQELLYKEYFRETGHILPPTPQKDKNGIERAEKQIRFTFSETDLRAGKGDGLSEIGPFPFRVVAADKQELIELTGNSNRIELLSDATDIARQYVLGSRPGAPGSKQADQTPASGTIEIRGPRPVNPNGIISAIAIEMLPGSSDMITTVSLDQEIEPLPNVAKPSRNKTTTVTAFGLDQRTFV